MMRIARWAVPLEMVQFMKAIAEVAATFEEVRPQAASLAPEEAKSIEDRMFAAKTDADRGFYARATLECHRVREQVRILIASLPEREADLEERWTRLSAALPAMLASIDQRLTGRRTTGMSRRWLEAVLADRHAAHAAWDVASAAAQSGRWFEAVGRGEESRRRAATLTEELRGF